MSESASLGVRAARGTVTRAQRLAYRLAWYHANRARIREGRRTYEQKYNARVKDEKRLKSKEWRRDHPERSKQLCKDYQRDHPEIVKACARRRRAREAGAEGFHTEQEWQNLLAQCSYRCFYCGTADEFLTRDHKIPLSRGGSDWIENITPACKSCNSKKGVKMAEDYMRHLNEQNAT